MSGAPSYAQGKFHCQPQSQVFSRRRVFSLEDAQYGVSMRGLRFKLGGRAGQGFTLALGFLCFLGAVPARAQVADAPQEKTPATRLLTLEQGRSIADAALRQEQPEPGTLDCSHIIHQIYSDAGFEYSYASSFELFAGNEDFARVRFPRPGDLIVWPGHVGIVVDPLQHSFSSLVSTGFDVQDYESAYWKTRGRPRFYRYKVQTAPELTAKNHNSPQILSANRPKGGPALIESDSRAENSAINRQPQPASERSALVYGPPAPERNVLIYGPLPPAEEIEASTTSTPFEIPSNIIVAAATKPPTREEVAEGISELNDAAASILRSQDPFQTHSPVVVVEQFNVTRIEIKRDRGWAHLQVESKVSIDKDGMQRKQRRENVRWELRRLPSGWEVVAPPDRTYVPHDVAVKGLAAQLAQLTQSNAASAHEVNVLRQESRIANLLGALLETK